jgi:predicted ATPase with chaperone activity
MRQQVLGAREIQRKRFAKVSGASGSRDGARDLPSGDNALRDSAQRQAGAADIGQSANPAGKDSGQLFKTESSAGDSSHAVESSRLQASHFGGGDGETTTNASMSPRQVRQFCKIDSAGEALLKQAMTELGLSARAHDKVLRTARTIADLEGVENIQVQHLAEAIQYRRLDRKL